MGTFDAATAQHARRAVLTLTNLIAWYQVLAYKKNTYELVFDYATEPRLPVCEAGGRAGISHEHN